MKKLGLAVITLLFICLSVSACGRKGSIRPPEDTAPAAVQFLSGSGQTDGITLTWVAPEQAASGESLKTRDLESFVIKRADYVAGKSPRFSQIGEVPFQEITGSGGAVVGGGKRIKGGTQFSYRDTQIQPGQKYVYEVLGVNTRGVEGAAAHYVRITFTGESTIVESINPAAKQD